jgi:hypothetical protein
VNECARARQRERERKRERKRERVSVCVRERESRESRESESRERRESRESREAEREREFNCAIFNAQGLPVVEWGLESRYGPSLGEGRNSDTAETKDVDPMGPK